jgi:UDP-glucose 4-epimerase
MKPASEQPVLVTGASGFLGTFISKACLAAGIPLIGLDRVPPLDRAAWREFHLGFCDTQSLTQALAQGGVKTIFHLAGAASVPDSLNNPIHDFQLSVPSTLNLLCEVMRHCPSAHVIFLSSAAVYGNPESLPVSEDAIVAPISPYGIHKAMSELALEHYTRVYGLKASVLRVFSAFGPGLRKQLFWDLSRRAYASQARGERMLLLQGTGHATRDFIFASDVAQAALHVANRTNSQGFEIYNIGSGTETSIREVASQLLRELDLEMDVEFDGIERDGVPERWRSDITKLKRIGFSSAVPLNEGIKYLADWLKDTSLAKSGADEGTR